MRQSQHNLLVNGGIGIYNHGDTGEITCSNGTSNLSSSGWDCLYRAAAGGGRDFLAGAEGATGAHGYAGLPDTPLAKRWPSFARLVAVNSTRAGWASAAHSNFRDNVFLNMSRKICLLTSYHPAAVRHSATQESCSWLARIDVIALALLTKRAPCHDCRGNRAKPATPTCRSRACHTSSTSAAPWTPTSAGSQAPPSSSSATPLSDSTRKAWASCATAGDGRCPIRPSTAR